MKEGWCVTLLSSCKSQNTSVAQHVWLSSLITGESRQTWLNHIKVFIERNQKTTSKKRRLTSSSAGSPMKKASATACSNLLPARWWAQQGPLTFLKPLFFCVKCHARSTAPLCMAVHIVYPHWIGHRSSCGCRYWAPNCFHWLFRRCATLCVEG